MQVPDEVRQCVVYLCASTASGMQLAGTGFLVGVKPENELVVGMFAYVVTAKHVLRDIKSVSTDGQAYLRLNRQAGEPEMVGTPIDSWETHPTDPSVDAAVLSLSLDGALDFKMLPVTMAATERIIELQNIGVGEDVYLTGLFINHFGNQRNLPIVRTGTIAAMPEEKIHTSDYGDMDAYLIEARSIGGLSGSPVFVYLAPVRSMPDGVDEAGRPKLSIRYSGTGSPQYFWLGLMHGHWDIEEPGMDTVVRRARLEAVNMGIAIVVPAAKVLEIINKDSMMHRRLEGERKAMKQRAPRLLADDGA